MDHLLKVEECKRRKSSVPLQVVSLIYDFAESKNKSRIDRMKTVTSKRYNTHTRTI